MLTGLEAQKVKDSSHNGETQNTATLKVLCKENTWRMSLMDPGLFKFNLLLAIEIFRNYGNGFKLAILLNRFYARTVIKHCKRC